MSGCGHATFGFRSTQLQHESGGAYWQTTVGGVSLWLTRQHAGWKKNARGCGASLKKERLGNQASDAYKSFRTMLLTGLTWPHVMRVYIFVAEPVALFFFCLFKLEASSSSSTTSTGMLSKSRDCHQNLTSSRTKRRPTTFCLPTTNFHKHKRPMLRNCDFSWFVNTNFSKLRPAIDQNMFEKAFSNDKFSLLSAVYEIYEN